MKNFALLAGFILALLLFSGPVEAETIRGTVVDSTGSPLADAWVRADLEIENQHIEPPLTVPPGRPEKESPAAKLRQLSGTSGSSHGR